MAIERTLIQIRERSFLDLLDLGLVLVRRRPLTLGLAALGGIAPFAALNAWLSTLPEFDTRLLISLLFLEIPWATAPLTIVLGGLMFGERPTVGKVVSTLARSFGKMLVYQGLIRALCVVTIILMLLIPARLAFLDEVILLERAQWKEISKRSAALCGEGGGDLFVRAVMQIILGVLFIACLSKFLLMADAILFGHGSPWGEMEAPNPFGWRAQLGAWIAVAFFGMVRFLSYIDQRIRREGWEVELRLRTAGATLREDEAW